MLTTAWGPVGTRGGCGAGWGPGACPGGNAIQWGFRGANRSYPNEDKHQAPSSTPPRPLSLHDPWAASTSLAMIPRFGRQYSSGRAFPPQAWSAFAYTHLHNHDSKYVTIYMVQSHGRKIS